MRQDVNSFEDRITARFATISDDLQDTRSRCSVLETAVADAAIAAKDSQDAHDAEISFLRNELESLRARVDLHETSIADLRASDEAADGRARCTNLIAMRSISGFAP